MRFQAACLCACTATLASCALPQFSVQPRYGLIDIDGSFGVSSTNVTAKADLKEMGLEEESAFGLRGDFKWGLPHVVVTAQSSDHSGTGTVDATLTQGGNTIPAGADVDSSLDLALYQGLLMFDVIPGSLLELALGLGVSVVDYDLSVKDLNTSTTIDSSQSAFLPVLAANAGVQFGSLELALLVSGTSLSSGGDSLSYLDGDLSLRWRFLGGEDHVRGSLVLGWRQATLDLEVDDGGDEVKGDADLAGPYLGLEVTL